MIRIDSEKLRDMVKRRGLSNFEEVTRKANEMGIRLAIATIYSIADNGNWTKKKLEDLCRVLDCDPRDFVYFERDAPKGFAPTRVNGSIIKSIV